MIVPNNVVAIKSAREIQLIAHMYLIVVRHAGYQNSNTQNSLDEDH